MYRLEQKQDERLIPAGASQEPQNDNTLFACLLAFSSFSGPIHIDHLSHRRSEPFWLGVTTPVGAAKKTKGQHRNCPLGPRETRHIEVGFRIIIEHGWESESSNGGPGRLSHAWCIYPGMRVNSPRGLKTALQFSPRISSSVNDRPDGLLLYENLLFSLFPLHVGMRQIGGIFQALEPVGLMRFCAPTAGARRP